MTDVELVDAARGGDRHAMDQLLRRHHDRVFAVCRRITGNDADAADASQEALISIVRSLGKFDGRSSFGTWVYRIATNASLDELRRRRRRPTVGMNESVGHDVAHDIVDPDAGIRIDVVAERMAIDVALAGISEDFRVPIVLRDLAGLDYGEIAEVVGIPIGTVKSRIARGRANLSELLRPGNQPGDDERPRPAP
jgi:RNA polymerase sigma-70 factor, ECF subfamily